MSVCDGSVKSSMKALSPNQSLILDEIDDEDEDEFMKQRHASYGFFNRKFIRRKLKGVFPSGFTIDRVRKGKDLLPYKSQYYGRNKLPYGAEFDDMRIPTDGSQSEVSDAKPKSYHDAFKGERGFKDDMTDSVSLHGPKGDDFADVAGPYFHEIGEGAARKRQQAPMPVIPTVIAQSDPLQKVPSSTPDYYHHTGSPSGSPDRPRTAQELTMKINISDMIDRSPLEDLGEYRSSITVGFGEPSGSITSLGYGPPQQNKELVTREVHLYDRRGATTEDRLREKSIKAKQPPIQSTAPFIAPSKLPPMPAKTTTVDHEQEMEEKSIASLESLVKQTSSASSRKGAIHKGSPDNQRPEGSTMLEGSVSGSHRSHGGSPLTNPFSACGIADTDGGVDTWPRRGQYTAPPRERPIKRSTSPSRKSKSSTVTRSKGNSEHVGSGDATDLGLDSPGTSPGKDLLKQPDVSTTSTANFADEPLHSNQMNYEEWIRSMPDDRNAQGGGTSSAPSLVVNVKSRKNASRSGSGDGSRRQARSPPASQRLKRTPLQEYLEGRLHAVRDGHLEDTTATVDVFLYSFLSLMGSTSLDGAIPYGRFSVGRETNLSMMIQMVADLVGSAGLTSNSYYEQQSAVPRPTLYTYNEKNKFWQPLVHDVQLRLALLNCLADFRPLKIMYSLKFGDEIDEAFYHANGRPTLEDIQEAERQRLPQEGVTGAYGEYTATLDGRRFSDSLASDDVPDMIKSMSLPPEGLSPGQGVHSRKGHPNASERNSAVTRTNTASSGATRVLTANNLHMKLMTQAQTQAPPRPAYGQAPSSPSSSTRRMVYVKLPGNVEETSHAGSHFKSKLGKVDGRVVGSSSLATLGVTHIPPMKRSNTSSLSAGRGLKIADKMSREKQEAIANELQQRLLKTEWIFPS